MYVPDTTRPDACKCANWRQTATDHNVRKSHFRSESASGTGASSSSFHTQTFEEKCATIKAIELHLDPIRAILKDGEHVIC